MREGRLTDSVVRTGVGKGEGRREAALSTSTRKFCSSPLRGLVQNFCGSVLSPTELDVAPAPHASGNCFAPKSTMVGRAGFEPAPPCV